MASPQWVTLEERPELPDGFPTAHVSPLASWHELEGWDPDFDDGERLIAALEGDGTPAAPLVLRLYPVGLATPRFLTVQEIAEALEGLWPGGVQYVAAYPPQISGAPGLFAANTKPMGAAAGYLELVQVGALAGGPAALRWSMGGGHLLGQASRDAATGRFQ